MDENLVRQVVEQVLQRLEAQHASHAWQAQPTTSGRIPVEVSSRHVHLSAQHMESLFGPGYSLTPKRELSQPGQFLCEERVRLIGPKCIIENVAVLGPVRGSTQVELSAADARVLGVEAPARMSGDLTGAAGLLIATGERCASVPGCAIVAKAHIHMSPADSACFGVQNGQKLPVRVGGDRPIILEEVEVRVNEAFRLALHIDVDEANACLCGSAAYAEILCGHGNKLPVWAAPVPAKPKNPSSVLRVVVSAQEAKALCLEGGAVVLPRGSLVTPLARDVFNDAKIRYSIAE